MQMTFINSMPSNARYYTITHENTTNVYQNEIKLQLKIFSALYKGHATRADPTGRHVGKTPGSVRSAPALFGPDLTVTPVSATSQLTAKKMEISVTGVADGPT